MIRKMCKEDLPFVAAIEEKTFSQPWSIEGFYDAISMEENHYVVCEEEGKIVGYCGYYGTVQEGEITNVAIEERYRNRGYGRKMLTELMKIASDHHVERLVLEVRISNDSARHLYQKLGFKELGIRKNFYQHPIEDAVIMECMLEGKKEC